MRSVFIWAILFLIVGLLPGCSVHAVGVQHLQRDKFLEVEEALKQKNFRKANSLLEGLTEYPLYSYLLYKKVSSQPHRLKDMKKYIDAYGDTRYAFSIRKLELKHLAAMERWQDYVDNYKPMRSTAFQCAYYWALYKTGKIQKAMEGAEKLWLAGRSQPTTCDPLFSVWQKSPNLTTELVWKRFGMALDNGKTGLARYLRRFLLEKEHNDADFWLSVHRNTDVLLQCEQWKTKNPLYGRIFSHGIKRLVRKNPVLAGRIWKSQAFRFNIETETKQDVERRVALFLALVRDKDALDRLRNINLSAEEEDVDLRHWRVRSALMNQNWAEVAAGIRHLTESEKAEPQWQYWNARALAAMGKKKTADGLYRSVARDRSLYGFLAADRLGLEYSFSDKPLSISEKVVEKLGEREDFQAVHEFLYFKRENEASRQWSFVIKKLDRQGKLAAAKLAEKWGWGRMAIMTLAKAKHWDDLELRFPLLHTKSVFENSQQRHLNPALIFGLVRRESAFDHHAISPVGARGLMQIMPQTGRNIARKMKEKWRSEVVLFNPELNIRYGTSYFSELLNRFDHNFVLAMAAYNAGPHRVERWLPKGKTMPADIWAEIIPYKETRGYVNAVLTYAVIYQKRLDKTLFPLSKYMPDVSPLQRSVSKKRGKPVPMPVCG